MNRAAPTDPEPTPSDRAAVRLTREAIVAQAMLLVRAEGLGAVSMRRIADELGTGPMSLYRHLGDRKELLIAMLDQVARGIDLPPPVGDARSEITALLTGIHDALGRDPWAVQLLINDKLAGPSILPVVERLFAALAGTGLTPRDTSVTYALLWHYTVGEILDTHHTVTDPYAQHMVRTSDPEAYPALHRAARAFAPGPRGDWFAENLQRLLDGVLPRTVSGA
jgi:AcrR family transcriptional regulator